MSQTKNIYLTTTLWLTNDQVFHVVIYTEWEADTETTQDTRKTHTHAAATQRLCLNTSPSNFKKCLVFLNGSFMNGQEQELNIPKNCRTLTKVNFFADQVRRALVSAVYLFVWSSPCYEKLKTALFQTCSTWHRNTFCPYCLILTQYHQVPTRTALYWPNTIIYQPVPPYTDQYQYHYVSTTTASYWSSTIIYQLVLLLTDPVPASTI